MLHVDVRHSAGISKKYLVMATVIFSACIVFLFSAARPASAAVCTFASAGGPTSSQDFGTNFNWSCSHVPTNGDYIIIPGNTTTIVTTSTAISVSSVSSTGAFNLMDSTLTASSSLYVSAGGAVTSTSGSLSIGATSTIAGSVSSTSGTLTFTGAATTTATGLVGNNSGNILFSNFFTNAGTFRVGSGNATTTGSLINLAGGKIYNETGILTLIADFVYGGSYYGNTGTFRLAGGNDQSIASPGFYALWSNKSGGTATFITSAVTVTSTFNTSGAGTLSSVALAFTVTGASTITGTTVVTSTTGVLTFTGAVVSSGSIGSISGNILFSSTYGNTGTFNVGSGTATTTGAFTNTGGTVQVSPGRWEAPSTIANTGTITLGSGTIIHAADSIKLTNSSGVEATFSTGDGVYVTVQDGNRNLDGTAIETMTIPVTINAAGGSDSETLTLTETTVSSGIFRNSSAINLVTSNVATAGNSQFELTATGVGTASYTDNQDSTDTGSDTATFTYVAASASSASTGGGGLGSSGSNAIAPVTPVYQTNLQNLQNIGVQVHGLIKLPDDGNANTQADSAVYYVGSDGKRHAFPNDKVYFTWYVDFSGVQVVNLTQMASIPLGANVTYKPGKKMVKFTTDAKVYAVAKGGVLRWVKTEAAAIELYGSAWNTKIDDINDAFYTNYKFGTDIVGLSDFNPTTVEASVSFPSDSLQM